MKKKILQRLVNLILEQQRTIKELQCRLKTYEQLYNEQRKIINKMRPFNDRSNINN